MLNYLWTFMILAGIVFATFNAKIELVTTGAIDSAGEAVSLCITMLGVVSIWTGLMQIASKSGIINMITEKLLPFMQWIFPDVPANSKAMEYISTNMIANFLGLGWAATPAALMAMKELKILNNHSESASDAMCTFLVINISSIQLIPVNIIAFRTQYGAVNPAGIILPALIATTISTLVAICFCKIMQKRSRKNK